MATMQQTRRTVQRVDARTILIDDGQDPALYDLRPGEGPGVWLVAKVDADGEVLQRMPYRVRVGPAGAGCTCPGHVHRGKCRHLLALLALSRRGRLKAA